MVDPESATGAAETCHYLVGDQQDPVVVADRTHVGPPVVGGNQGTGGRSNDRFGDHRGDGGRVFEVNDLLKSLGVGHRHLGVVGEHPFETLPAGPVPAD